MEARGVKRLSAFFQAPVGGVGRPRKLALPPSKVTSHPSRFCLWCWRNLGKHSDAVKEPYSIYYNLPDEPTA